jgi:arylsulfatase A-like enzyme
MMRFLLLTLPLLVGYIVKPTTYVPPRPNIVFLLADDLRFDALSHTGNRIVTTPNIDRLARDGVRFRNAYVTTAICCVSRATLLSGQYARRHGIHDFNTSLSDTALARTYPVLLRKAGYYTGFIGKWGINENNEATFPKTAFDVWHGVVGQGQYYHPDSLYTGQHLTDRNNDQIAAFIRQRDRSRPFCLSVSFKAPHIQDGVGFLTSPAYDRHYADMTIPPPPTANAWESFPAAFKKDNEARSRWEFRFGTPAKYQESVKRYYRLITHLDAVIGHLRTQLAREGLADNTVIVFTSDNGFYLGDYGMADKWYGHDISIRVPLLLYDPRLPRHQRTQTLDAMALNLDVAPTLLGLGGVNAPARMQGQDLYALIRNPKRTWRAEFFYEHLFNFNGRIPRLEGVVTNRYKYFRFLDLQPRYDQLFDPQTDPNEVKNLALDPRHSALLTDFQQRWASWRERVR